MSLSNEQIQALLGKTREKGVYVKHLNEFIASNESGICANETWVDMNKKPATLKQGFENAKENKEAAEGAEFVKVISNDEKVYLINLKAAGLNMTDGEDESEAEATAEAEPVPVAQ